jgi:hypothetical protein
MATLYPQLPRLLRCVRSTTLSEEFQVAQDRLNLNLKEKCVLLTQAVPGGASATGHGEFG